MKTGIIITISVISGVLFLLLIISMIFKSIQSRLGKYIQKKFDKKDIIGATTRANFFGEKAKGSKQLRGNGALVLTKNQLFFVRAVPLKEFKIPIRSISKVSLPASFNGKSVFSKLLCVHYTIGEEKNSIAWEVKNPETWKNSIKALIS